MKDEKTVLEWLEMLPEPIRSQAIENWENDNEYEPSAMRPTLANALALAFDWGGTPKDQGYEYWRNIKDRARSGEFDTLADLIPWPEEAAWDSAPENVFARGIDADGSCFFYFFEENSLINGWIVQGNECGQIQDMTGTDWRRALQFRPR